MLGYEGKQTELVRLISTAVLPWFSTDALATYEESYFKESQSNIDMCCGCGKKECDNCLGNRQIKQSHKGRPKADINIAVLKRMIEEGAKVKTICTSLHISRRTYFNYKSKLVIGKI